MPGHTHRSERARLFFLQLLGAWITVRSEWAIFPLLFLLGFLDQLSGGPAHRYFFNLLPFRGFWGNVRLICHFFIVFSKDYRYFYNAFFRKEILMAFSSGSQIC